MNFLKSIKNSKLINSIVDRSKSKTSNESDPSENSNENSLNRSQSIKDDVQVSLPDYEDAEAFLIELKKTTSEREQSQNLIKRKIQLFQKVEIEPHYLSPAEDMKLLNFQFHLGSDIFLERIEHLHEQLTEINGVVKRVLTTRKEDAFKYLEKLQELQLEITKMITSLHHKREHLRLLKDHQIYRISRIIKKKNLIKEKIRLLKNVKTKNEAALIQIQNIDQAFATEQSRAKLYKKINKLTELQKSKYVGTIKSKLISVAMNNKQLVEEGLSAWVRSQLSAKQIEKLSVMIYFMQKEDIYQQNNIKIDFHKTSKEKLKTEIKKIFQWKNFTYVKDLMTKQRIHQFLNYLLKKIQ